MNVTGGSTDVTTYFVLRLAADGTEATGLTITNFDLQYVRSGAAPAAKVDATALAATDSAHGDNQAIEIDATDQPGLYRVDWPDAAFAAGVKEVILTVKCATCFTEHLRVTIDSPVNVTAISGDTTAADNAEAFFDGTGYAGTNNVIPTVTTVTNAVSANVTQISGDTTAADNLEAILDGTGGVTLVVSAITLTTPITANATQISGDSTAADNAEAFFDGTGYAGTNNVIPTVTTLTGHTAQTGDCFARLGAPAGASVSADVAAVKAQTAAIETDTQDIQSRLPAALTGDGNIKADTLAISGDTTAADNLEALYEALEVGTAQGGAATTITLRAGASATNDIFKNQAIVIRSGTGAGQTNRITAYVGATKVATVATTWVTTPDNTSVYAVLGRIG